MHKHVNPGKTSLIRQAARSGRPFAKPQRWLRRIGGLWMLRKSHNPYLARVDAVSKALKIIVIALVIAVAASQLALQIPQVRKWVTGVDRLEGTPF